MLEAFGFDEGTVEAFVAKINTLQAARRSGQPMEREPDLSAPSLGTDSEGSDA